MTYALRGGGVQNWEGGCMFGGSYNADYSILRSLVSPLTMKTTKSTYVSIYTHGWLSKLWSLFGSLL